MSFLETIAQNTRARVAERRARRPLPELRAALRDAPPVRSLHDALAGRFSVIAEHKRRAPSAGVMKPENVADAYDVYAETPWISAVSVLTDEDYFEGSVTDLIAARERTRKPILRKDFIVDEYQVVEARAYGADAILLMASVLFADPPSMRALHDLATSLGLGVLVELGMTERRIEDLVAVVPQDARIWGINARSFAASGRESSTDPKARRELPTDVRHHLEFRRLVPPGRLSVAESGIHTSAELVAARSAGYDAALVGTAFLRGPASIRDVVRELSAAFSA